MKRSILSLQSATAVELVRKSMATLGPSSGEEREPLGCAALSGTQYGLDRPVLIQTPSHARRFAVTAAAGNADPIEPASAITAAKAFLDDLFRGGHVDYGNFGRETRIEHGRRLRSHRLVAEDGSIRLKRVLLTAASAADERIGFSRGLRRLQKLPLSGGSSFTVMI